MKRPKSSPPAVISHNLDTQRSSSHSSWDTQGRESSRSSASQDTQGSAQHPLWLRINAFLSTRAPNTQSTYAGVISEWCGYLGAPAGGAAAADKMLSATELHAISYRGWLTKRRGETPRWLRPKAGRAAPTTAPHTERLDQKSRKKDGLEATLSNATIHKKFAVLRRIYRMLVSAQLGITENPFDADRVPAPAKEAGRKRPTEMISFDEVKRIFEVPDLSTPKGVQDHAILCAFFGAGLRRSEVLALRVGDLRSSPSGTPFLYLRSTKAKRDAQAALPEWAASSVRRAQQQRQAAGAGPEQFLFVSFRGKGGAKASENPLSASGIYKMFRSCCARAELTGVLSPHSARATAITKLLSQGIPHRLVQEFSRHASIQMVELYDKRRIGVDQNPGRKLEF